MHEMILEEARGMGAEELRELIGELKAMVMGAIEGPSGDPGRCPRCGRAHVVRKGHDADGAQRWLCRGCGRTFSRKTMGLLSMSRPGASQWERFRGLAARHAPLAECARECGVSAPTAHFMRVRLCQVMEVATPAFRGGNAQVDATYIDESMSGLGRRGGTGMPREPHRTGHDVRERGGSRT